MSEVERLYRQLVRSLAAGDPARLHQPLQLSEIRDSILPYRSNRRALQLETSEDYELALMRLCAGEGGLARTEPEAVQVEFAAELRGSNPDLTLLHKHEQASVRLAPEPLRQILRPSNDLKYAPPEQRQTPVQPRSPQPAPAKQPAPVKQSTPARKKPKETAPHCVSCGGALPPGRKVQFCPQCGTRQSPTHCSRCGAELEPGWKHCVGCGAEVNP